MAPPAKTSAEQTEAVSRQQQNLIDEFRSLIDEATILAITGDYDSDLDAARQVLLQIAENVQAEEASGFDPSGLPDPGVDASASAADTTTSESTGRCTTISDRAATDYTSASARSGCCLGPAGKTGRSDVVEDSLRELFPGLKPYDITSALNNAGGDAERGFEELQNIQYFEETGERPKGVDGFFRLESPEPKKHKGKKPKVKKPKVYAGATPEVGATGRPPLKNGRAQLPVAYTLTPLDLDEPAAGAAAPSSASAKTPLAAGAVSRPESRAETAAQLQESGAHSFEAARQAFRRAGSNHLLRQAVAFFDDRGREQIGRARQLESEEYDAVVDEQSEAGQVDLHGVPVRDGVRIALAKAQTWWDGLGEAKAAKARSSPLVIVTGLGRHNANGVSRLRQSVGAALKREGWDFTTGTGQFILGGRQ